ncbi:MAG: isoprenylcysteine carboxylmethyltransferase family protein [Gemmatimonadetes bacterium]|nr:isoprenylcysteine carboxylmethyltransferase family protein [Gemmatimonadota bacterium]MBK7783142.1 isoprenylcysteine carboxylmethyltransferase family protein [Gemmatimonadota bacterium]MBK9068809.1 isoprenylcysteine carboxylmethyltransferase family protein [Gemmatimonadota bacterium]
MPLWLRATAMTLLFPGMVAGVIPYRLAHSEWALPFATALTPWLGWPLILVGTLLLILTIWAFAWSGGGTLAPWDAPTTLVQGGLYRWVRNPMYLGVVAAIVGQGLLWSSAATFIYAAGIAFAFHVRVVRFEEPVLRQQFGPLFEGYLRAVPRWVPRRPRARVV